MQSRRVLIFALLSHIFSNHMYVCVFVISMAIWGSFGTEKFTLSFAPSSFGNLERRWLPSGRVRSDSSSPRFSVYVRVWPHDHRSRVRRIACVAAVCLPPRLPATPRHHGASVFSSPSHSAPLCLLSLAGAYPQSSLIRSGFFWCLTLYPTCSRAIRNLKVGCFGELGTPVSFNVLPTHLQF